MGKGIYTYYKERLIEISGNNKCLYLKKIQAKGAYDIGRIFEGRDDKALQLVDFLFSKNKKRTLTLLNESEAEDIAKGLSDSPRGSALGKKQLIEVEIAKIKELKREIEDIEKETGRYELFIGYPFVFGSINSGSSKMLIKAPLLLFPVKIDIKSFRVFIGIPPFSYK